MKLPNRFVAIVTCVAIVASATLVVVPYFPKLIWYFGPDGADRSQLVPVPIETWSELQSELAPSEARLVAFGDFQFALPDVFRQDVSEDQTHWRSFECDTITVHLRPPTRNTDTKQARFSAAPGFREDKPHSYVRMIEDIYSVSTSSFRWSMTSDEFSYFRWLLEVAENRQPMWATKIAVYYGENVDFVIYFLDKSVLVEVYPQNGDFFGSIIIDGNTCRSWTPEELAREICASFSIDKGTR